MRKRPSDKKLRVLQRWIKALKSGKYKQGYGFFKRRNRHCAVGVLQTVEPKHFDLIEPCEIQEIIDLNDHKKWPFGMIAVFLEQKYLR